MISLLLLCLLHSFLFYGNDYGLSVILFIGPLLCFILYYLNKNKLIKNKKGLLLIIPIILLSLSYLIFNNAFFHTFNIIVIPVLFILLFIFTIKPNFSLFRIIDDTFNILFEPFKKFSLIFNQIKENISKKLHLTEKHKKIITSFVIIIPIVLVILLLLMSADMVFDNLISNFLEIPKKLFKNLSFEDIIFRSVVIIILFFYILGTLYFLKDDYVKSKKTDIEIKEKSSQTIIILLICLNIIYIIFDIIQIKSLMLHSVSSGINYANYARQGFFQLMFVSLINIIIILISKKYQEKEKTINILSLIMVFLTFIIIISSALRMNLYEAAYGYTLLRLLVYIILFTETVLIIPLVIYIFNNKFNIVKSSLIIIIGVYTFINFINIDSIIAKRNIQRYYEKNDIDIYYLENGYTDNINELSHFYSKVKDNKIKSSLNYYFRSLDTDYKFQEFSVSKYQAKKILKEILKG